MSRSLYFLIAASGIPYPVAGDSFDTDVVGTTAGVKMTDYIINGWSYVSGGPSEYHAHNDTLSTVINIAGNSLASNVMAKGNVIDLNIPNGNPGGFSMNLTSNVQGLGNFTLTQQFVAPVAYASTIVHHDPWFDGHTSPSMPQYEDEGYVRFRATKGSLPMSSYAAVTWDIDYFPDAGSWNPPMTMQFAANVLQRADDSTVSWYWEWFDAAGYNAGNWDGTPVAAGTAASTQFYVYTEPGQTVGPYYVRGRPSTGGYWRNGGGKSFTDNRTP